MGEIRANCVWFWAANVGACGVRVPDAIATSGTRTSRITMTRDGAIEELSVLQSIFFSDELVMNSS